MATIGALVAVDVPRLRAARHGDRSAPSILFLASLWAVVAFAIIALLALLVTAFVDGISRVDGNLFSQYASEIFPETAGARAAILGSFWVIGTTAVLAIPLGYGPDLLVHVLTTALQARGVRARVLSGGRPAAVTSAVERMMPTAVVLDVGGDDAEQDRAAAVVRAVAAASSAVPLFVHRGGSSALDLPVTSTVHRVRTLTGALHEILAVVS